MSEKCRKIIYALVVTVFAAFLWMICCENDRKVSDKAIGETNSTEYAFWGKDSFAGAE